MVGSLRGKYLNYLARLELIIKGNKLSIDLCALHSVADLGVDCVGKVDYGCARRQGYDIALGSECENILGSKVALDGADNFLNIVGFLLGFNYLAYPCQSVLQLILSLYCISSGLRYRIQRCSSYQQFLSAPQRGYPLCR